MVDVGVIQYQRRYYEDNLEKLAKKHGGQYIFILDRSPPKFFRNKWNLEAELDKYRNMLGPTIFTDKIPTYPEAMSIIEDRKNYPFGKTTLNYLKKLLDDKPHKPNNIKIGARAD